MKKVIVFSLIFIYSCLMSIGQDIDSLSKRAVIYASQNKIEELRDIYESIKDEMPHHFHLYCAMSIARYDGHYERALECVDSLYSWYPKQTNKKARLSLAEIKASILRNLGEYEEMYEHCAKEIKYFQRYGFTKTALKELIGLQAKAKALKGNSDKSLLLQAADRGLIVTLDSLYNNRTTTIDDLTRLRCEILLSQAFHHPDQLLQTSQELIENHAEVLDAEELTFYIKCHAEELMLRGDWKNLLKWAHFLQELPNQHMAPLDSYLKWAEAFLNYPQTSVSCPTPQYTFSTSYEWPILFKVRLNHGEEANFSMDTAQPYTFVTEDWAEKNQITLVNDTLVIPTSSGMMAASPAIVEEMSIGELKIQHLLVYVLLKSNSHSLPYKGVIGLNQWLAFDRVTFFPEEVEVEMVQQGNSDTLADHHNSTLFLSRQKGLQTVAQEGHILHPLSIDCSFPNNFLYQKYWKMTGTSTNLPITIGEHIGSINAPNLVDYQSVRNHGVLGVPFLKHYQSLSFDFRKMQLNLTAQVPYQPCRHRFNHATDKHYLARNYDALTADGLMDHEERLFLDLVLSIGKNAPLQVSELSRQLREEHSDFYNCATEAEAIFKNGDYVSCIQLIKNQLEKGQLLPEEEEKLHALLQRYQLFAEERRPSVHIHHTGISRFDLSKDSLPTIKIHKRKASAHFDLFYPHTEIAEKYVRRYKVKEIGQIGDVTFGIIPKISCGKIDLLNIPCRILKDQEQILREIPDKGKGIHLGWDALRHFHQISFSQDELVLSTQEIYSPKSGANLYLTDQWYMETETEQEYRTIKISPSPTSGISVDLHFAGMTLKAQTERQAPTSSSWSQTGNVNFKELVSKAKIITFDLKEMKLISKNSTK